MDPGDALSIGLDVLWESFSGFDEAKDDKGNWISMLLRSIQQGTGAFKSTFYLQLLRKSWSRDSHSSLK